MPQLILGCHLSSSKGFLALGRNALHIGANTFQFFTRNPRGSKAKPLDLPDAQALRTLMAAHGFGPVLAHAPYTLNACSADARVREFALETMADDLSRMEALPGNFYNLHPGSHVGQGAEAGISLIANTLNQILWPEQATTVLLETMAGKGSELGTILGVFTVAIIENGMNFIGVNAYYQNIVFGIFVLAAIALTVDRSIRGQIVK